MSITVADCLSLPSLKEATVIGGAEGLDKIVASVTVLEYAEISYLKQNLFSGNELIITAFASIRDDVDKQCAIIRHLYKNGVIALVLYYVGVIVTKVDKRVLKTVNELGLPLIAMPRNNIDCRYGEVISEVMEAILYENIQEKYFVPTLIDRVAQFPEGQRTLGNILRILSDRFRYSIFITDEQMRLVTKAMWPVAAAIDLQEFIDRLKEKDIYLLNNDAIAIKIGDEKKTVYFNTIRLSTNQKLYLFVILDTEESKSQGFDKTIMSQICESVRIMDSMQKYSDWSKNSDLLINAILNNDSYRMKKRAGDAGIDIKSIHNLWIFIRYEEMEESNRAEAITASRMLEMKEFLSDRYKTALVGSYGESIIGLMGDSLMAQGAKAYPSDFMRDVNGADMAVLIYFDSLQSTFEIRKMYDKALANWFTLKSIYSIQSVFNRQELDFAEYCRKKVLDEQGSVSECIEVLKPLLSAGNTTDFIETLSVFLLDSNRSIDLTAEIMHLHPSTIKYRLKAVRQKLNRDTQLMPDVFELYLAVAINRILSFS